MISYRRDFFVSCGKGYRVLSSVLFRSPPNKHDELARQFLVRFRDFGRWRLRGCRGGYLRGAIVIGNQRHLYVCNLQALHELIAWAASMGSKPKEEPRWVNLSISLISDPTVTKDEAVTVAADWASNFATARRPAEF